MPSAKAIGDFFWVDNSQTRRIYDLTAGGMVRPTPLALAVVDDYAPLGVQDCGLLVVSSELPVEMTGLEAPDDAFPRGTYLLNIGVHPITLTRGSGGSAAGNRFQMTTTSHVLRPQESCYCYYEPSQLRWMVIGRTSSGLEDVCFLREIFQDQTVPSGATCIQSDVLIADGVEVFIDDGGELYLQ